MKEIICFFESENFFHCCSINNYIFKNQVETIIASPKIVKYFMNKTSKNN